MSRPSTTSSGSRQDVEPANPQNDSNGETRPAGRNRVTAGTVRPTVVPRPRHVDRVRHLDGRSGKERGVAPLRYTGMSRFWFRVLLAITCCNFTRRQLCADVLNLFDFRCLVFLQGAH